MQLFSLSNINRFENFQIQIRNLFFECQPQNWPLADRSRGEGRRSKRGLGLRGLHTLPSCPAKAARSKSRGTSDNQTRSKKGQDSILHKMMLILIYSVKVVRLLHKKVFFSP